MIIPWVFSSSTIHSRKS